MGRPRYTAGQDVEGLYAFGTELGRGNYGAVRTCMDLFESGPQMACKTIPYASLGSALERRDIQREVDIMKELGGHGHIVELLAVHRDQAGVHLVVELCRGGELFEEVLRRERFSESDAMDTIKQLAAAVEHCHSRSILHRDIKLENVLLTMPARKAAKVAGGGARFRTEGPVTVKLTDFGLAVHLKKGQKVSEVAGSPFYMAPEVIRGQPYSFSADIWSLGVILFALLSGLLPFTGSTNAEVFRAAKRAHLDLDTPAWAGVSESAKRLVRRMLSTDPLQRPSARDLLKDPCVTAAGGDPSPPPRVEIPIFLRKPPPISLYLDDDLEVDAGTSTHKSSQQRWRGITFRLPNVFRHSPRPNSPSATPDSRSACFSAPPNSACSPTSPELSPVSTLRATSSCASSGCNSTPPSPPPNAAMLCSSCSTAPAGLSSGGGSHRESSGKSHGGDLREGPFAALDVRR